MTAVVPSRGELEATRPFPARTGPKGNLFYKVITTTDHKLIGIMYVVTCFIFFAIAGLMALFIRAELAVPGLQFLSNEQYNQLFTMHGTAMLLFYATPIFVTCILVLLIFPLLTAAAFGLAADRRLGAHIYDPANGGITLFQHLFWYFGHPEVYVIALPFFGIVTEVFPVFSRKPVFGYSTLVYARSTPASPSPRCRWRCGRTTCTSPEPFCCRSSRS